jgi:hypothetical protein
MILSTYLNPPSDLRTRLWIITSEYESLLQCQNEHFAVAIKSKDREIELLKKANEAEAGDVVVRIVDLILYVRIAALVLKFSI